MWKTERTFTICKSLTNETLKEVVTSSHKSQNSSFIPEADVFGATQVQSSTQLKTQTMVFTDGDGAEFDYVVHSGADSTRTERYSDEADLGDFMSRPIRILTRTWVPGSPIFAAFDPWSLFFQNKRVINRINNFNLMRATLKVKFMINGNGFYYGRAIASYLPHAQYDNYSKNRSTVSQDLIQASQQPHVQLDPTTSTGGVLTLPFMYYYDFINITDGGWSDLGDITLRSINDLAHANGNTEPVTVSVFAWAEDVELSVPTSVSASGLVPQAAINLDETDEANAKGVISGPATAIANAAASLKSIPLLNPYASATEIGARMTSRLAKLFGYSRPIVTKAPETVVPQVMSSMAMCTVPDVVNKLTVDDKQSLGMGSEIAGISSGDPMQITAISQRESYLTTFTWSRDDNPDALLWNSRVVPYLLGLNPLNDERHMTAMAYAALPFDYWTGSIKFRFQVVSSAFHKGRLRVVYDPNYLESNVEFNVNHQEIVDICDKQDFTVVLKNSQERGIIPNLPRQTTPATTYGTSRFTTYLSSNGVIGLYVLNELTSPNALSGGSVQVNVYVSTGEDFRVFSPNSAYADFSYVPQADMDLAPDCAHVSAPVGAMDEQLLTDDASTPDKVASVYCGETIASFRQLLKRYNHHSTLSWLPTGYNIVRARRASYPYIRGQPTFGTVDTSVDGGYNYCLLTMLQYVTTPFAGARGSIRHRMIPAGYKNNQKDIILSAYRTNESGYAQSVSAFAAVSTLSQSRRDGITEAPSTLFPPAGSGMTLLSSVVNDVMSFELPFQREIRYGLPKPSNTINGEDWNAFECVALADGNSNARLEWYVAAGEDYQVFFWTGPPPMTLRSLPKALP